jgi:hypothetical protein
MHRVLATLGVLAGVCGLSYACGPAVGVGYGHHVGAGVGHVGYGYNTGYAVQAVPVAIAQPYQPTIAVAAAPCVCPQVQVQAVNVAAPPAYEAQQTQAPVGVPAIQQSYVAAPAVSYASVGVGAYPSVGVSYANVGVGYGVGVGAVRIHAYNVGVGAVRVHRRLGVARVGVANVVTVGAGNRRGLIGRFRERRAAVRQVRAVQRGR